MSTRITLRTRLEAFQFDAHASNRLAALAEEIDAHPEGAALIGPVLQLFERFPLEDFGAPGPLVHAIERYYEHGYEAQLAASLLWLAHRVINANDRNAAKFRDIVRRISQRTDLPQSLLAEAREYLADR